MVCAIMDKTVLDGCLILCAVCTIRDLARYGQAGAPSGVNSRRFDGATGNLGFEHAKRRMIGVILRTTCFTDPYTSTHRVAFACIHLDGTVAHDAIRHHAPIAVDAPAIASLAGGRRDIRYGAALDGTS